MYSFGPSTSNKVSEIQVYVVFFFFNLFDIVIVLCICVRMIYIYLFPYFYFVIRFTFHNPPVFSLLILVSDFGNLLRGISKKIQVKFKINY